MVIVAFFFLYASLHLFYKHLLYNCGAFLCDLFLIFYCWIFVMMTCLVIFFGQSVMQLNVYGLYLKLMLTFRCTFIFVCIIVSVVLPVWRNKVVHKLLYKRRLVRDECCEFRWNTPVGKKNCNHRLCTWLSATSWQTTILALMHGMYPLLRWDTVACIDTWNISINKYKYI